MHGAFRGRCFARGVPFAILSVALSALAQEASASTYKKLYEFCAQSNCADGWWPLGTLYRDEKGNLFGTASNGGDQEKGTIFELVNNQGAYTYTRLYSFCALADCVDGGRPVSGLIRDIAGNFYGTTTQGGAAGHGGVFRLSTDGQFKVLYSACVKAACKDGMETADITYFGAANREPYDGVSPLYGVNRGDGNYGAISKLVPAGHQWNASVVHNFSCKKNCTGRYPNPGLLADADGNLYGTTEDGGAYGGGTLFQLNPNGQYTVLYDFCPSGNCAGGAEPTFGVIRDRKGDLRGTTYRGGMWAGGTVYRYSSKHGYSNISLCGDCGDSSIHPRAGLAMDRKGHLYGTALFGGSNFEGAIFMVLEKYDDVASIYDFCGFHECGDSAEGSLIIDRAGNIYGTTAHGGSYDLGNGRGGVVYELTR